MIILRRKGSSSKRKPNHNLRTFRVLLIKDQETPTTDLVHDETELDNVEVIDTLEVLSQLDCIHISDDGIIELYETIIVKQDDSD